MKSNSCLSKIHCYLVICGLVYNTVGQNAEQRLYNDLFTNYSSFLRPVREGHYHKQIIVHVSFVLYQIESLSEKEQKLSASGFMTITWKDEFLTWNHTDYEGANILIVPGNKAWLPEISPINSVLGSKELAAVGEDFRVRIFSDGTVVWLPSVRWETTCKVDVADFPYDKQQCEIQYANWMYSSQFVNFTTDATVYTAQMAPSLEWNLNKAIGWIEEDVLDSEANWLVPMIKIKIFLQRDPTYFELNVLVPAMLLSFLMIPMFMLPVESGEKVALGVTLMLAYSIFLLMMTDVTPRSGTTPKLTLLILACTMAAGFSVFLNVAIINIHYHSPEKPVPGWVKELILGKLGKLLCCMNNNNHQNTVENSRIGNQRVDVSTISIKPEKTFSEEKSDKMAKSPDTNGYLKEIAEKMEFFKASKIDTDIIEDNKDVWNKVARTLDRLLMICYTIFFLCTSIAVISMKYSLE